MTPQPTAPSKQDVLQAIAELFSAEPTAAVLAHYPTLRIQTLNLHGALTRAIEVSEAIVSEWKEALADDVHVAVEFCASDPALHAYKVIGPALVRNVHKTADFLLEETRPLPPFDVDQVSHTTPSFSDFIRLGASVRGFIDALVQSAYQLSSFDGAQPQRASSRSTRSRQRQVRRNLLVSPPLSGITTSRVTAWHFPT